MSALRTDNGASRRISIASRAANVTPSEESVKTGYGLLHRAAIIVAATSAMAALGASPAAAGPDDPSRPDSPEIYASLVPKGAVPITGAHAPRAAAPGVSIVGTNSTQEEFICTAWSSPSPQYSPNPARIHWGVQVLCNFYASMHLKAQLFNKLPNMPYEPASALEERWPVGEEGWVGADTGCFTGTSSTWRITFWGSASVVGNLLPYPAYSAANTLPCS